jgi:hypothetical protein
MIGVALDYILETRILLPNLSDELINEAKLFVEMTKNNLPIWDDPVAAQDYLDSLEPILDPFVMLLDLQGQILASTDPFDACLHSEELKKSVGENNRPANSIYLSGGG